MPQFKTRDDTAIRFKELGEGRPVILIHGWPLSADSWDPVMMHLAENGMRAIAMTGADSVRRITRTAGMTTTPSVTILPI